MMTGEACLLFPWETDCAESRPAGHPDQPSGRWRKSVMNGTIRKDCAQESLLPLLDQVVARLNTPVVRLLWRGVEVWRGQDDSLPASQGLYLHGDVGRGKSMLMQIVFDTLPIREKRRVHFHPFMEELHQRMHHATPPKNVDLILYLASTLSAEARLLCFDEFYITNIADGILLGRLLDALHHCGVTLCATSNWAPDHLFQDGINRESVMPFIARLKQRTHICALGEGVDWRRQQALPASHVELPAEELFKQLTGSSPQPVSTGLRHTSVRVRGMAKGVFWFAFEDLCSNILGRAEYMTLCSQANMVIISDLPRLSPEGVDTAMRFVVLVDLLYEHQIPLRIYSQVDLEAACPEGDAAFAWRRSVSRVHALGRISGVPHA
ncbi:MAG: cell division protein ZapE [Magnetococcus sp. YQC-3]